MNNDYIYYILCLLVDIMIGQGKHLALVEQDVGALHECR